MAKKDSEKNKETAKIGFIKPRSISKEMAESYIDYAMSVIVSRALPDVRDGLKPVQRRILYTMNEMGLKHDAKFRKSATVVGECFVKDTLILTPKGLIPIQEIQVGDHVYTQSEVKKVTRLYKMPKKPLLRVTLENGLSNVVTFSQRFKVLTPDWKFEWKEAKDLTKSDYLVVKADYPEINSLVELNRIEDSQPRYLNENIAYLLGILISDGSVSEDYSKKKYPRLNFGVGAEKEIAEKIVSLFREEFNYIPTIEVDHYQYKTKSGKILNNKRYQIRVNRKFINEFFVKNFELKGLQAPTKKIPSKIFQSPPRVIFSFISGLIDGDGSINPKKNCIQYSSTSEELINGLLILLLHQGVFSSKYTQKLKEGGFINGRVVRGRHKPYSLEVRARNAVKLAKLLTTASKQKTAKIRRIIDKENIRRDCGFQYDIIPYAGKMLFRELSKYHLGGGWYQDINRNKFRMGIKHRTGCKIRYSLDLWEKPLRKTQIIDWGIKDKLERIGSSLFKFLESIIKNKIYFLKVSSIRKYAPQETYDLKVEGKHEFIANGVISHNCMGKFHPHGDTAIYDALVRMAQDFSLRYPLVQGQGNFASIDDPTEAAAMRYTEAKLSKIGEEMLKDIEKETVDFMDNYDATRKEPQVLPSPLPQLLLNGTVGIAVGMATNIPPHNLSEVCEALIYLIDHPEAETPELLKFIKGPDFPTGGIVFNGREIVSVYSQGKGAILTRGKAEIEALGGGRSQIVISEIPFQVSKAGLLEKFAKLVEQKQIEGVRDIRDESDREGMRIVLELSKTAFPQKILNRLYKFTDLQKTFHLNMIALVDGIQPRLLNLAEVLSYFLSHRKEVVIRRAKFELRKAKERAHILEGLHKCLAKIDAVIKTIKASKDRERALENLMKKFELTEVQAKAILETRLQQLARLEREKIETELREKKKQIKELTSLLKSPKKIKEKIKEELRELQEKFGDKRRTRIVRGKATEISEEDLVPLEETVIILTKKGFIKRVKPSSYKAQKRGGKGILGTKIGEEDMIEHFLLAETHDLLLFFTEKGKVFQIPAYEIPEGTRLSKGKNIANFLEVLPEEKILNILPRKKKEERAKYLLMATEKGLVKKTSLEEFAKVRKSGLIAIHLKKGDSLKKVVKTTGKDAIILVSKKGKAIIFKEEDLRPMSRQASGNIGMRLGKEDKVVGVDIIKDSRFKIQDSRLYLLTVTEKGFGKKTPLSQYRLQKRGGAGLITAKLTPKSGPLAAAKVLTGEEEHLIVISQRGHVIKIPLQTVRKASRATRGVKLINLSASDKVASIICV